MLIRCPTVGRVRVNPLVSQLSAKTGLLQCSKYLVLGKRAGGIDTNNRLLLLMVDFNGQDAAHFFDCFGTDCGTPFTRHSFDFEDRLIHTFGHGFAVAAKKRRLHALCQSAKKNGLGWIPKREVHIVHKRKRRFCTCEKKLRGKSCRSVWSDAVAATTSL